MIPLAPPPLPDVDPPRAGAVAAWACVGDGAFLPIWVETPRGGLALRLADTSMLPHLAVVHVPSGYALISTRVGGAPIRSNRRTRALCRLVIGDLLAAGSHWEQDYDPATPAWRRCPALLAMVQQTRLPAVPEWRAWRLTRTGQPYHCWTTDQATAIAWARARRARWWAVEHWLVPPGGARRTGAQPLRAWARGDEVLPEGMASLTWGAGGETHVRSATQAPTSAAAWSGWPG